MKTTKTILTLCAALLISLVALNTVSAAYYGSTFDPYYGRGSYDSNSYHSQRTTGDFNGYRQTTTNQYNRVSEKFWDGNDWVDRTTYTRETRDSPNYYANGYKRGSRYSNYYNVYPSYGMMNYNYDYPYRSYGSSVPYYGHMSYGDYGYYGGGWY